MSPTRMLAGYPSGSYTGSRTLQVVGSTGSPAAQDAEIVNQALKNLGFKTRFNLVDSSAMYAKYCGVPAEAIESKNVAGVGDLWNSGAWDYAYTSLK